MKYGRYSPKCITDMYSDRNIHYIDRSSLDGIKDVLYIHIPYVETEDKLGYMFLIVCPDDVYIISYMHSVIPFIQVSAINARMFMLTTYGSLFNNDVFHSMDYNVLIATNNNIGINAEKLREYQIVSYNALSESPHLPTTIPNFKKEYKQRFFVDGGIENWKYIITLTILLWIILL